MSPTKSGPEKAPRSLHSLKAPMNSLRASAGAASCIIVMIRPDEKPLPTPSTIAATSSSGTDVA
eukprot:4405027-Prymnesium_polylepis.3